MHLSGRLLSKLYVSSSLSLDPSIVADHSTSQLPAIFAATDLYPSARNNLLAFLAVFSEDSGYRNRVTYTAAALAAVRGGISRETFEAYFVNTLSRLSRDGVANVRIGVARAVSHACRTGE